MSWKVPGSNKRRDSVLMVPSHAKLSEKIHNSLKVLPEVVGVPQKCWMKWLSRRTDFVANERRPGVRDGGIPDYQFLQRYSTNVRPACEGDTKIILSMVDNPGEVPVFTLFTKVGHVIQSLWILHFSNFSYRRFISPRTGPQDICWCWATVAGIRTLIFLAGCVRSRLCRTAGWAEGPFVGDEADVEAPVHDHRLFRVPARSVPESKSLPTIHSRRPLKHGYFWIMNFHRSTADLSRSKLDTATVKR